jgi:hypothetical protein
MRSPKGRLELTWMGKDMALIPTAHGKYDYEWVDPVDLRACEVKSIEVVDTVGEQTGENGAEENLLIVCDSGDALRSPSTVPEWAATSFGSRTVPNGVRRSSDPRCAIGPALRPPTCPRSVLPVWSTTRQRTCRLDDRFQGVSVVVGEE